MIFLVNTTFQLPPCERNIINYFQCHCRTYFTLHSFTILCSRLIQVSIVSSYSLILYTRQQEVDECSFKQPFVTCSKWLTSAIVRPTKFGCVSYLFLHRWKQLVNDGIHRRIEWSTNRRYSER
jgi:hypothetical protein